MVDQNIVDNQEAQGYNLLEEFINDYFSGRTPSIERTLVDSHFDIYYTSCTRTGIVELKTRDCNLYPTVLFEKLKYDKCMDEVLNGRRFVYICFWRNKITVQDLTYYFFNPDKIQWKKELHNLTDQTNQKVWKDVAYLPITKFTKTYSR